MGAYRSGTADVRVLERRWHVLDTDAVLARLRTATHGLATAEARARALQAGRNEIVVGETTPWWRVLARQFVSPLIGILVLAVGVTTVLRHWVDAGAILLILVVNAGLGFWHERRAESAVRALQRMSAPSCRALRDGVERRLPAAELVPGDVVLLASGERVPADLRLLETAGLRVDESLLTGEVMPVVKDTDPLPARTPSTDRNNIAFSGTLVSAGRARGVVVATGAETELGAINALVQGVDATSPLQELTHGLERRIGMVVAVASLLVFVAGLALGYDASQMFRTVVALAVAAVPESLPIVLTVAMSLGVARMARHGAIVRSLLAVETLGSTTNIGSDKTGTLTRNEMTVQAVWTAAGVLDLSAGPLGVAADGAAGRALRAGALTNEAVQDPADPASLTGDAVDVAMARAALGCGVVTAEERAQPALAVTPYEPALRYSQALRRLPDGTRVLYVKGSPDVLAPMSTTLADGEAGRPMALDVVDAANDRLAAAGMRVIATAERVLGTDEPVTADDLPPPRGLTLLGLEAMEDPPRPGVADAIADCHRAGIRVTMITGDHPGTAASVAERVGLPVDAPPVTGAELADLDDDEVAARLDRASVAARVSPQDKLRIVRVMQSQGHVVAVTGDGVNDAPALKAASIGVAMGRSGTDVAREAADVVLTDDNFVTIVDAVRQGRVTFSAIRNATFFLLASGLAALLAVGMTVLAQGPLLFLPVQWLWVNVVTNGIQDVALAFEPPEGNELRRPPRSRSEGVLSRALWLRTAVVGAAMALAIVLTFQWALEHGYDLEHARTLTITLLVMANFYLVGTARSETRSVLAMSPLSNRVLIVGSLGALLLHLGAMTWPVTAGLLGFVPLSVAEWLACIVLGAFVLVIVEADKLLRWRVGRRTARTVPAV